MLWAFSIWLESVAILPQLFMLQRTGEAETITTHYLFALGAYRALYIPNWIYRWFTEGYFQTIPVLAGLIQTVLYSDFFYIYYTKYVIHFVKSIHPERLTTSKGFPRQEVQLACVSAQSEHHWAGLGMRCQLFFLSKIICMGRRLCLQDNVFLQLLVATRRGSTLNET